MTRDSVMAGGVLMLALAPIEWAERTRIARDTPRLPRACFLDVAGVAASGTRAGRSWKINGRALLWI